MIKSDRNHPNFKLSTPQPHNTAPKDVPRLTPLSTAHLASQKKYQKFQPNFFLKRGFVEKIAKNLSHGLFTPKGY